MRFFQHFTSEEFFPNCSADEIVYCVGSNLFDNLLTLIMVLDVVRDNISYPIIITSSYRDHNHNKKVGGSPTSQHMAASAIDFKCPKLDWNCFVKQVCDIFADCPAVKNFVGQVIIYHKRKFIHVGLRTKSHPKLSILHYEQRDN